MKEVSVSWIQRLYDTYLNNQSQIGVIIEEDGVPLLPVYHGLSKSNIEVTINEQGEVINALLLSAKEPQIIIPMTESSDGRSGAKPIPHPLVDKLQYLAGDYLEKGGVKYHGYSLYKENLRKWNESSFSNKKINAVYACISRGTLIEDISPFIPASSYKLDEAIVRWRVIINGDLESNLWKDHVMFDSWGNFYMSQEGEVGYCQVTDKILPLAWNHPKKINNLCANAKLISANDNTGFTFRGQITRGEQAYGVSVEATQKAHNALKWLISKQGYRKDSKCFLCWSPGGIDIENPLLDTLDLFADDIEEVVTTSDNGYTAEDIAHKLTLRAKGYQSNLEGLKMVVLMTLEAVTDGRLSITYYQELEYSDYLKKLDTWHNSCKWLLTYRKIDGVNVPFYGTPSPWDISEVVLGFGKNVKDSERMGLVDRIVTCIIDGRQLPLDILSCAIQNTVKTEVLEEWQFNKSLAITCALYRKYRFDYFREEYKMALDYENKSRDYLYGRLLAVAQNIERWALNQRGENRPTNADRLMQRFADRPYSTWKTIELSLRPSFEKLQGKVTGREKLIDEIMSLFETEDFIKDTKLSGEFLLGYHNQREAFRKRFEEVDYQAQDEN